MHVVFRFRISYKPFEKVRKRRAKKDVGGSMISSHFLSAVSAGIERAGGGRGPRLNSKAHLANAPQNKSARALLHLG